MKKAVAFLVPLVAAAGAFAQSTTGNPADALTALGSLSGSTTAYGPFMFGAAVISTGIMVGVAWIKKFRGAAR